MKLTQKHFNEFKAECLRLQKAWGLTDWELYFMWQNDKNVFASINPQLLSRKATLFLSKDLPDNQKQFLDVKASAKHEMIHLLLAPLEQLADSRYVTRDEMESGSHSVVIRLMKLI